LAFEKDLSITNIDCLFKEGDFKIAYSKDNPAQPAPAIIIS
jgi:hypothetical protein